MSTPSTLTPSPSVSAAPSRPTTPSSLPMDLQQGFSSMQIEPLQLFPDPLPAVREPEACPVCGKNAWLCHCLEGPAPTHVLPEVLPLNAYQPPSGEFTMNEIDYGMNVNGMMEVDGGVCPFDLPTLTFPEMIPQQMMPDKDLPTFPEMIPQQMVPSQALPTFPEMIPAQQMMPSQALPTFPEMIPAQQMMPSQAVPTFPEMIPQQMMPSQALPTFPEMILQQMMPSQALPTFPEMMPQAISPKSFVPNDFVPGDVPPAPCSTPSSLMDLWKFVPSGDSQFIPDQDLAACLYEASSKHTVSDVVDLCDDEDDALPTPCGLVWQAVPFNLNSPLSTYSIFFGLFG